VPQFAISCFLILERLLSLVNLFIGQKNSVQCVCVWEGGWWGVSPGNDRELRTSRLSPKGNTFGAYSA
jgi:hypothetical protein